MGRAKLNDEQKLVIVNNLDKTAGELASLLNSPGIGEKTVESYKKSLRDLISPVANIEMQKPTEQPTQPTENPPENSPLPVDGSKLFINETLGGRKGVAIMTEAASMFGDEMRGKGVSPNHPIHQCTTKCKP